MLYAYAAMQLFERAATTAPRARNAGLRRAMRGGTFKTVIGDLGPTPGATRRRPASWSIAGRAVSTTTPRSKTRIVPMQRR